MDAQQRALFLESVSLVAPDLPSLTGPIDGARVSELNYGGGARLARPELTCYRENSFGDDHGSSATSWSNSHQAPSTSQTRWSRPWTIFPYGRSHPSRRLIRKRRSARWHSLASLRVNTRSPL